METYRLAFRTKDSCISTGSSIAGCRLGNGERFPCWVMGVGEDLPRCGLLGKEKVSDAYVGLVGGDGVGGGEVVGG